MPIAPKPYRRTQSQPRPEQWASRTAEYRKWYKSPRWLRLREYVLQRDFNRCQKCGAVLGEYAQVDHIVPHRGDYDLFFDDRNLQALCGACHSAKTSAEEGGFGNARK